MKKIMILSVALICMFVLSSTAMAGTSKTEGATAGTTISLTGLDLNFSPKVAGWYTTEGTTGNEQWYGIAAYHGGGEWVYASSSQQTAIWKQARDTNDTFSSVTIPTTEANSNSQTQWTSNGWAK